eukprot:2890527-Amphidinium_carterae.1
MEHGHRSKSTSGDNPRKHRLQLSPLQFWAGYDARPRPCPLANLGGKGMSQTNFGCCCSFFIAQIQFHGEIKCLALACNEMHKVKQALA